MQPVETPVLMVLGAAMGAAVGLVAHHVIRWGLADISITTPSIRARVVMALTGVITMAGATYLIGPAPELVAWWWFVLCAIILTTADLLRHRLPDRLVLPSLLGGVVLLGVAALAETALSDFGRACVAAIVVAMGYLLLALLAPTGLGMGDVKLSPLIGLYLGWMGWASVVEGVFAGFIVGAVWALVIVVVRRGGLHTRLPFGPSMLLGVAGAALLHASV
jgi:leader peptidase (prepilin peptidase) / N-methyltransferase